MFGVLFKFRDLLMTGYPFYFLSGELFNDFFLLPAGLVLDFGTGDLLGAILGDLLPVPLGFEVIG